MSKYIKLNHLDNVAVAVANLNVGDTLTVEGQEIKIASEVPVGHKFALKDLAIDDNIIKYGYPIGHATQAIKKGEHVHTQNIKTNLHDNLQYSYEPQKVELNIPKSDLKVNGFMRYDGQMGIRNELWIVPTVIVVSRLLKQLEEAGSVQLGRNKITLV
ncbi:SAF domain-containing protein [Fluviicola sp.]|uniref:UxaA family hydrolase n=1 Tax=Fluviicola sp. TaxID=1917219 RepID=UPI0026155FFB|nr:SAF domain-containing protein [Fluviicola sp.]